MKIKDLYSDSSKWTKAAWARNKKGETTYSFSPTAYCFCLSAAIGVCYAPEERSQISKKIRSYLIEKNPYCLCVYGTIDFNDHSQVKFEDIKKMVEELDI